MQYGVAAQEELRKESRQTFSLSANPRVEVLNINNQVTIQTYDSDEAEVQVIRRANRKRDLKYHTVRIEHTPDCLVVKGTEDRAAYRRGISVEQQVTLLIPRRVSLEVRGIGGSVWIGAVEGAVKVERISGSLEMRLAENLNAELTAESIGGGLYVNLSNVEKFNPESAAVRMTRRIGAGGVLIVISKVSGSVIIR